MKSPDDVSGMFSSPTMTYEVYSSFFVLQSIFWSFGERYITGKRYCFFILEPFHHVSPCITNKLYTRLPEVSQSWPTRIIGVDEIFRMISWPMWSNATWLVKLKELIGGKMNVSENVYGNRIVPAYSLSSRLFTGIVITKFRSCMRATLGSVLGTIIMSLTE